MKARWLASVAVAALAAASPALAADLPLKAPPPVVAAWSWSGFYIGGHAGYGWGRNSFDDVNDGSFLVPGFIGFTGFDPKGFLGGIHAGANWQTGSIVASLEGDLSFTEAKGSSLNTGTGIRVAPVLITLTSIAGRSGAFDMLGSARARLGYLVTPDVLLYGTGGPAWTDFVENTDTTNIAAAPRVNFNLLSVSSSTTPTWRLGWVAGLGAEARLLNTNWLARIEYLHYDFGNSGSSAASAPSPPPLQTAGNLTVDVLRAGLSYKFDPDRFSTATSSSAGLYTKAPVTLPWSWSGFYVGAHTGYGWARDPFNNLASIPFSGVDSRGFIGGFQAGANWQSGAFVGGLEIDLSGTGIKGSASNAASGISITQIEEFDRLASARARLGYLATPSVLLYGTGGPAWTRFVAEQDVLVTQTNFTASSPTWQFGWVAGAGVETRLGDTNWLARLEYLHYDFGPGSSFEDFTVGSIGTVSTSGHRTADVVRTGLGYKFDWPGYSSGGPSVMPVKAAAAPAWSWSGFYLGGHAGYGWGRDPFDELVNGGAPTVAQVFLTGIKSQGFVGGFQAGANWQAGKAVGGLEIDLSGAPIKGSSSLATAVNSNTTPFREMQTDKFDLLGSARARLGYLVSPNAMLYGTGGLGWTQVDQTTAAFFPTFTETTISTTPSWRVGWVAGAGAEARLCNTNWLARVEYLHYDFGKSTDASSSGASPTTNGANTIFELILTRHLTADVVRTGISYKFN